MNIESCLVDSNILLRMTRRQDPQHHIADKAVALLAGQGTILCYTHQNIAEIWNVMTRPLAKNGLGLTVNEAEREVRAIELKLEFLPDNELVYREWRRILSAYSVSGIQVYDARLVATMAVYGIRHILTFDVSDFSCYSAIMVLHPTAVS
jgi:predicted nucleic acid-binding protein